MKSIKRTAAFDDSEIFFKVNDAESSEGELIFYSDSYEGRELKKSFIEIDIQSVVNLNKMKM